MRGHHGRLPRLPRLDDESYQSFVEGVRVFAGEQFAGPAIMATSQALGIPPAPSPRIARRRLREADRVPLLRARNALLRHSQSMMWRELNGSYAPHAAKLEAALAESDSQGPGTLEWSPGFEIPAYTQREFHIQPGGYQRDAIAGHVYHYGTKVFFLGANDQDGVHQEAVQATRVPADSRVERVLDLACSIGQGTTALKSRFPGAQVHGIDIAAPMLRYAHQRANSLGAEVHFAQRLAERTGFPDAHFDLVHSMIFFHEVPFEVTKQVLAELFRIIRPGGVFNAFDFPSGGPLPAGVQYFLDIDAEFNGEPYSLEFVYGDFKAAAEAAGFQVETGPPVARFLRSWSCTRPSIAQ